MIKKINLVLILTALLILFSCNIPNIQEEANQKFGDQHFKTAISLIELHNIRQGEYPSTLKNLTYIGDWDKIIFSSVKYTKLDKGYELDLTNGWLGKPDNLNYPNDFWNGLGLVKSNMKN
jgi:hypothetical protein